MMVGLLRKEGYDVKFQRVETADQLRAALQKEAWDLVLADYNLPEFNALSALRIVQDGGFDIPFIIVSGGIGEDIAVSAMKAGAHDYLMKGNLNRLAPAVGRELREAHVRSSQRTSVRALHESEMRYRLLWENSPDAVLLMNTEGRIQFANPAVRDIFGYSPEEVIGKNLSTLQPDFVQGNQQSDIKEYLKTGVKKWGMRATETLGARRDGVEIPIEVSFSDMELNGERNIVAFIRDVSQRKRAEAELRDHAEQFRVARDIQQRLFPKAAPECPGFDVAGRSYPAEATGGDYFDYLPMLNDRIAVIVGDVTGHGVGPALLMAETRAYLRVLVGRREDAGEILTRANKVLSEDVGSERFITLFLARLDCVRRSLVYASAGHPSGFILNRDGGVKRKLPRTGIPLGLRPDTTYESSSEIRLEPGDLVLLTTDGIEETISSDDKLFGNERLLEVVRANQKRPAREIVDALYLAACQFSGNTPQLDDVTAIVIKVDEKPPQTC